MNTNGTEVVTENKALTKIVNESGLQLSEAETIKQSYLPYFVQIAEIEAQGKKINFESPTELDEKIARDLRLQTVKVRTGSELIKEGRKKIHALKANVEQSAWNLIKSDCQLMEEMFLRVEKKREIAEQKRKEELKSMRLTVLLPLGFQTENGFDLGNMDETMFQSLKLGLETAKKEKEKAEEERIAKEKAEAEERAAVKAENERLKKENEAKEKAMLAVKAKADTDAKKVKAISDKAIADAKAKTDKLTADLKAKTDADAKAKRDAEVKATAELKAQQLIEKKAAQAPDKQKLIQLAGRVDAIALPELRSQDAKEALKKITKLLKTTSNFIREQSENL